MSTEDFAIEVRRLAGTLGTPEDARLVPLGALEEWEHPLDGSVPPVRLCLERERYRQLHGQVPIVFNGEPTGCYMDEAGRVTDLLERPVPPAERLKGLVTVRIKVRKQPRIWREFSVRKLEKDLFPLKYL